MIDESFIVLAWQIISDLEGILHSSNCLIFYFLFFFTKKVLREKEFQLSFDINQLYSSYYLEIRIPLLLSLQQKNTV